MSSISQFLMYSSRNASPCPQAEPKPRQVWTADEDRLLAEAVAKETPASGSINWCKVALHLSRRNNKDCRKRWHYNFAHNIRKGTWTREEDQRLREAFDIYGPRWSEVAKKGVESRNGDQCWKRWYDCLDPMINRTPWTPEEDILLLQMVSQKGRSWTEIVKTQFPTRTSLSAKNRFLILRRRQESAASPSSASSPASSTSHSRSSTPNCRPTVTSRTNRRTTKITASPSPLLMTTSQPQYLSPTPPPPTSNQLTPELGHCFTPSPLSLSDSTESTISSQHGFGLGLLLPPSAMSMATSPFPAATTTATATTTADAAAGFDLMSFDNNVYNFTQSCNWTYTPDMMMVSAAAPTFGNAMSYTTSNVSPFPSVSASSASSASSSSFSSSAASPPSLSLNGLYIMPVVDQGLNFNDQQHVPVTTTQVQAQAQQQQQQQQFEFLVQTPTPTGTGTGAPVGYANW
ncbi:hypothetical protein SMACR_01593 [Sordaria macrospora]|uniref:WGS project CABT00000000 data, contig 2.4 n=2 Tax=Sordaria macrospora TaxID=5147 RepID=F7VR95_SORMK|nr:uncharacterized protein SMAC_01593 [Sordaria macrospora k-hell]KAA8635300.1 hypothetical protein SMACR_01593 [Sordaria macrospora]KAH7634707.1 hypothetical protein B0T09DRAFT_10488 [Sordaria sp. MPI-SDFR-AT-0083]WPJ58517.1 hypothetical protein SMAC4_01593 [Sordaria macrospora]CCC08029.1 unnamed protein product [Sordaria macrospora k-hell]